MKIENNQECFVQLWLRLEHTRRLLEGRYKRFCIRSVLKSWFGLRGNRRLHLGSLLKMQSGRLEQLTAADALSASESRNAPSPRLSRPRHRNTQSAPFRTRQSLQHRVPQQHPAKCEQKETKVKESSHRKRWLLLLYSKNAKSNDSCRLLSGLLALS